jgi:hypothetical protein
MSFEKVFFKRGIHKLFFDAQGVVFRMKMSHRQFNKANPAVL